MHFIGHPSKYIEDLGRAELRSDKMFDYEEYRSRNLQGNTSRKFKSAVKTADELAREWKEEEGED